MNFHISPAFESKKKKLFEVISNFNSYKAGFGTGQRNSVKKIDLDKTSLIIKSFRVPNFINQIVYKFFRKSKARRSYEYAKKLLSMGVKTPPPIAYIEYFSFVGIRESFYISEFIDYDLTYRELTPAPKDSENEKMLQAFTKFTYDLHEKGIQFLDHSPGNTLIKKTKNGYEFYLVDLNRMKFGALSFDQKMKNFSRLSYDKSIVSIMSKSYAAISGQDVETVFKSMWFHTEKFFAKAQRKREFKRRFLGKK